MYVIGDVLGVGGMGIVYAAVQVALDRTVALKLPRRELADDPVVRKQFQMEAIAGARIRHGNVVGVVDFGVYQGAPFLVMEHVVGPRLGDLVLEEGPLALPIALGITGQLLGGLSEAHAQGIVHGDLKSDNVIVELVRDGSLVPRLIDFGLARFTSSSPLRGGGEQLVAGTPDYLAPELLRGGLSSFASDVYALGAVCFEMITGDTPFGGGSSAEIMRRQLEDLAVPMSCRRPGVPPALDRFVATALAKIPERRYSSAAAMAEALAEIEDELRTAIEPGADASPILCSPEATTSPMSLPLAPSRRFATGTPDPLLLRVDQRRHEVLEAMRTGNPDVVVIAYLELARALVDIRELTMAISELEEGIELLAQTGLGPGKVPVWRLQLTLAALYDGSGDRARACQTMREAHVLATRQGSETGQHRALELFNRLMHRRSVGPPREWLENT